MHSRVWNCCSCWCGIYFFPRWNFSQAAAIIFIAPIIFWACHQIFSRAGVFFFSLAPSHIASRASVEKCFPRWTRRQLLFFTGFLSARGKIFSHAGVNFYHPHRAYFFLPRRGNFFLPRCAIFFSPRATNLFPYWLRMFHLHRAENFPALVWKFFATKFFPA